MPKIKYSNKKFNETHLRLIGTANEIIVEYQEQGFDLTLRQLYYQFVARDIIPNNMKSYKNLGSIINDARMGGLIDWTAIVDRTRNMQKNSHWDGPRSIVETCANQFQIDKWLGQEHRVEVWIEKDALAGVIEPICRQLDVPYFSCRGYTSQSEMWSAAQRLDGWINGDQTPVIIHLGDHDPSGIDMTRDITDRMETFIGAPIEVNRIALNMNQIEQYNPPPNPAKITDSRAAGYMQIHGNESWELDALSPIVITRLIERTVRRYRDEEKWAKAVRLQDKHKASLAKVARTLK